MTLRRKTLLLLFTAFGFLLLALYSIASNIILTGFLRLEEREIESDIARVREALRVEVARIDTSAADWAGWDEPYRYIVGQNPNFERETLVPAQVAGLKVDAIALVDNAGNLKFAQGVEAGQPRFSAFPAGLRNYLGRGQFLCRHPDERSAKSGLLALPDGPMLFSSRPILSSFKRGPVRGTLLLAQKLDAENIARIAQTTRYKLQFFPPSAASSSPLLADAKRQLLATSAPPYTVAFGENEVTAHTLLRDVFGKPLGVLQLVKPAEVMSQGQTVLQTLMFAILGSFLLFGLAFRVLLHKIALERIESLSGQLRAITRQNGLAQRVATDDARDEIADLAQAVNGLLASLETGRDDLQTSERRFRVFMDNGPAVAYIKNREGRLLYVNARFETQFSQPASFFIGKSDFDLWPPEVAQTLRDNDLAIFASGEPLQTEEFVPTPDGEMRCWLTFKFPLDLGGETVLGGMAVDITQRKAVEKLKNEFVATVSHELRTPLTAIRGGIGLVAGGACGPISPRAQQLLEIAASNSERLSRLINDILDVEKIEHDRFVLDLEPLELGPLVASAIESNSPVARDLGARVCVHELPAGVFVNGNRDRLTQVLTNLLSNAVKFSPPDVPIDIALERHENGAQRWARVKIHNGGPPIPEAFHAQVFEKFAQADASNTRKVGGTGLGLAISKAIIEKHGGRIGFDSDAQNGTTFWFELREI